MKVITDLKKFSAVNPIVTIGTFDGVHLGHRKVIHRLQKLAQKEKGETVLFTFHPHPRVVLNHQEKSLRLINTLEEKKILLESIGIDHLIVYPFTLEFSRLSYKEFIEKILVRQIGIHFLVIGYDHHFGHNREGSYKELKVFRDKYDFKIERLEALNINNINISSTKIRKAIDAGDIKKANSYLGYNYFIRGKVVGGQKIGCKIGYPTANIIPQSEFKLIPCNGVYAVEVEVDEERYRGMLNIGVRPTMNNQLSNRIIEVHIFDFSSDIYYKDINVIFHERIRDEQMFKSMEELKIQLGKDQEYIRNTVFGSK